MKNYTAHIKYFSDVSFIPVMVTFWNHSGNLCNRHYTQCLSGMEIEIKVDLISRLKVRYQMAHMGPAYTKYGDTLIEWLRSHKKSHIEVHSRIKLS